VLQDGVKNVSRRTRNPFDLDPPCDRFVPGYGDPNADFHVIGDHPGRHGGESTGIPFTDSPAGRELQGVLADVGLVLESGDEPLLRNCYLSYLHLCVPDSEPTPADYAEMERFFDAELRAITAHVLLPVGEQAIEHVLRNYSPEPVDEIDVTALHASELTSGAWVIVPIAEPETWSGEQRRTLIERLESILASDYRRESDLGRFIPGGDPYLVR
jgi:uracil-DNA glycosylase family 4